MASRYFGGAAPDGPPPTFFRFFSARCARMASSCSMAALTSSSKVKFLKSFRRSWSLVLSPRRKHSAFFSSVSTWCEPY